MKKIIVIAALAIATLASCTKEEKISSASDSPISFNTAVGKAQTKALIDQSSYPKTIPFGTFAYYLGSGLWKNKTSTESTATTPNLYINNNQVSNTSISGTSAWTTGTAYYWPKTGTLSFFSYSPYSIYDTSTHNVNCDPSKGITITGYDVYGTDGANQTVDVMVAEPEENLSGNVDDTGERKSGYTGVPTVFHHVLSQIVGFNFTNNYYNSGDKDGDKIFTITKISINNIAYTGSYQELNTAETGKNNAGWTATSDIASYTLYDSKSSTTGTPIEGTENTPVKFTIPNGYLLVLPQSFGTSSTANITITYFISTRCNGNWVTENTTPATCNLRDIKDSDTKKSIPWAENKKITYNITFNIDNDQIYWAPSVKNWDTDNSGNISL